MSRWAIERRWRLHSDTGSQEEATTLGLVGKPACCLLGSAGSGKTFELQYLKELEKQAGFDVRSVRLAEVATSPDQLAAALTSLSTDVTQRSVICLDAVDEAMVPVATTILILASWIRRELDRTRPRLRISCRSPIWPRTIQAAVQDVYGEESVSIAYLQPLSDSDVLCVSSSEGVDGRSFSDQVLRSNVAVLSRQPLTLRMLIRLFQRHGWLPLSRKDLFSRAVDLLSSDNVSP